MSYILNGFEEAFRLMASGDSAFIEIVGVSLLVTMASTTMATLTGVPFGVFMARNKFPGRNILVTVVNTLMSLPTVVVGLMVYSVLSNRGPLGGLNLLYTRTAIIIGQWILIIPIIAGLTFSAVKGLDGRIHDTALALGADSRQGAWLFWHEARYGIMAAIIAGFGRVFAEVGISMMLGGNIKGYTRTITTAIALENSKGDLALGIALGIVLLSVAFIVNLLFGILRRHAE